MIPKIVLDYELFFLKWKNSIADSEITFADFTSWLIYSKKGNEFIKEVLSLIEKEKKEQ